MNYTTSFEYFSTFAPVAVAFMADEPGNTNTAYKIGQPLRNIDKGYRSYFSIKHQAYKLITQ